MSSHHNSKKPASSGVATIVQTVIFVVLVIVFVYVVKLNASVSVPMEPSEQPAGTTTVWNPFSGLFSSDKKEQNPDNEVIEETPEPTEEPLLEFNPYCTENTDPKKFINYEKVGIQVNGHVLEEGETYKPAATIDFGYGKDYTAVDGIVTFRGDNFRSTASYGYANMTDFSLTKIWEQNNGEFWHDGTVFSGNGWVGQPLMRRWTREEKAHMNMHDWAKEDDELVEVIYASMDGKIYFMDLQTGKFTRETMNVGYCFKGAGALDPRGYPIMYIGAGYDSDAGTSRAFIINLLDCTIMHTFGNNDDFSLRGTLSYFDGSALVDADTDQLIYPGENGIVYIMKLNTKYDEAAGTLSIEPDDIVKWHYYGKRTSLQSYWVGMEDSAVIFRGHAIMADNGGNLMCLDLNTLELDWVQDILDDSNGSPVLSIENGHPYVYISTSFHYGWRSYGTAKVPVWKIDAVNGEIVWQTDFTCYTESGVSGGTQSTAALGTNDLSDYVYFTVARTPSAGSGLLVCLDKKTGEIVWKYQDTYTWSSPVLVYNEDGSGYVVLCTYSTTTNNLLLLDGKDGTVLSKMALYGGIEASPAVYDNMLVIGTRWCKMYGIQLR